MPVCRLIRYLVHSVIHEVHPGVDQYRAHSGQRGSHGHSGNTVFGYGSINYSFWTKTVNKTDGRVADIPGAGNPLPDEKYAIILFHHLMKGFVNRLDIGYFSHLLPSAS